VKLEDSTRCFIDRPADGYNRQIQRETNQIAELGGEQSRSELAQLRRDSRQTVKTDTDKSDTGRQLK
jgi:hypothetical protein